MKKLFLMPLLMILCSCGVKNHRTANEPPVVPMETGIRQIYEHNEENKKSAILQSPSLTLEINGKTIDVPGQLADFQKAGWTLEYKQVGESIMKGEETNIISATLLTNDKGEIMLARFSNETGKDMLLKDCTIIDLASFYMDNKPMDFVLPGGIAGGASTEKDALLIYGKPDKIIDNYNSRVGNEDPQKMLGYYSPSEKGWLNIYIATGGPYEGKAVNFDIRWETGEDSYQR